MARYSTVRHNAFEVLTPEAVYWIGFLMADGCLREDQPYGNPRFKLGMDLKADDYEHLAAFCTFLEIAPPRRNLSSKVNGKRHPIVRKSVRSDRIAENLMEHGVVPRKSRAARASESVARRPEFWRGVFDGDGSVVIDPRDGSLSLELAGAEDLMKQFCEFCRPLYPNTKTYPNGKLYVPRKINTKYVYRVRMGGPISQHVLARIYDAPGPRLERKEQQFRDWQATDWSSKRGQYQVES